MISNYSLAADEDLKGRSGRSSSAASRTSFKTTTTAIEPEEVVEENGEKVDEPVQEPVSEAVQDLETMADEIELIEAELEAQIEQGDEEPDPANELEDVNDPEVVLDRRHR